MEIELCHCGRPLHYTNRTIEQFVRRVIAERGPFVPVTVGNRIWMVQRHYLALHGIKGSELATLGFQEVTPSMYAD